MFRPMKRLLALTAVLAGCASGSRPGVGADASDQHDAPVGVDGFVVTDGRTANGDAAQMHDAPPVDAFVPDAFVPVDAPVVHPDAAVPPDACVPIQTQLLANPTFDLTPAGTGWTENQPNGFAMVGAFANPEQSAPFNAYLGGELNFPNVITDILTQDVVIPSGTTKLELTGFYAVDVQGVPLSDSADLALTQTNGTPIEDVQRLTPGTTPLDTWTPFDHVFANPAALAGTTVRVRMTSTDDLDDDDGTGHPDQTNFLFDTFALTATHCP